MKRFATVALLISATLTVGCSKQDIQGVVLRLTLHSEYDIGGDIFYTSTCKSGDIDCVASQAASICRKKGVKELVWNATPPLFSCNSR